MQQSKSIIITNNLKGNKHRSLQTTTVYGHYTGQPVLANRPSLEQEDSMVAKFYCLHDLADGN